MTKTLKNLSLLLATSLSFSATSFADVTVASQEELARVVQELRSGAARIGNAFDELNDQYEKYRTTANNSHKFTQALLNTTDSNMNVLGTLSIDAEPYLSFVPAQGYKTFAPAFGNNTSENIITNGTSILLSFDDNAIADDDNKIVNGLKIAFVYTKGLDISNADGIVSSLPARMELKDFACFVGGTSVEQFLNIPQYIGENYEVKTDNRGNKLIQFKDIGTGEFTDLLSRCRIADIAALAFTDSAGSATIMWQNYTSPTSPTGFIPVTVGASQVATAGEITND